MTDPFATAAIRQRVLAAWTAAPVRLREDANAEEDLALGGYRDRLVVELAQNAADAAARSGVAGRLELTLRERDGEAPVLVAANTGAPLTAEGVQSLATLRASAKSDDAGSVGRFGVGFAAVLAVTDEPMVLSRSGGVRFSRDDTAALVAAQAAGAPDLGAEVRRRDGHVPALRLPFAAEGTPPEDFDTAVVLPLRDEVAADAVREQLAAVDDALLLALPALSEVVIDVDGRRRTMAGAAERWHVHRRSGDWTTAERAELLADRPTEERRQAGWQVLWAVPRAVDVPLPATVHAPTPTDEPLSLPALLLASLPLDPTRRHVAAGRLADRLVEECAEGYCGLLRQLAEGGLDVLSLVPTGLPAGALDGALRERVLARLPGAEILRGCEDGRLLRPREAVVLDVDATPETLDVLAPRLAGLVAAGPSSRAALRALGVTVVALSDVIEALPAQGDAASWRTLYNGLAPLAAEANAREALAAMPVPLADGRVVRGARGLLLPTSDRLPLEALEPLVPFGLRVVHPQAAHALLERLGAVPATARSVLDDPAVRAAVGEAPESDEGDAITTAVLSLVSAAMADDGLEPGDLPWLGDLPLVDDEGELAPASALVLPGSVASRLLDLDDVGVLGDDVVEAWSPQVLRIIGVLDGLAAVTVQDVDLHDPPDALADVAGFEEWAAEVAGVGVVHGAVSVVRDLDAVLDERWPEALRHMAADPALRRALLSPVRVVGARGARDLPSYTSWWLGHELRLTGAVGPGADDFGGLLHRAPAWVVDLDPPVRAALGVVGDGDAAPLAPELVERLLSGLADERRGLSPAQCLRAWSWLALADEPDISPPQRIRVLGDAGSTVVDAAGAVVVDDPRWLQRADLGGLVVAPAGRAAALADLFDIDLASERAAGRVTSAGSSSAVPAAVLDVLPGAPTSWVEHDLLTVDGHEVDWWVEDAGTVHAATYDGLARALAWAAGRWPGRHAVAAVLADPAAAALQAVDAAWDVPGR